MPPILIERLGSKLFRGLAVVFRIADTASKRFAAPGNHLRFSIYSSPFLTAAKLIIVIVNGEIPGQSGGGRSRRKSRAQRRMKRSKARAALAEFLR